MVRAEKIAKKLFSEERSICAKRSRVFNDVVSVFSSHDNVKVLKQRPHKGFFEVNGYKKDLNSCVAICKRKVPVCTVTIVQPQVRQKMRYIVEIKNNINDLPQRAKAKFEDDVAKFVDGPYKGEEVHWSSRIPESDVPNIETCTNDVMIVVPDMYRSTFYGWKRRS
jgi:hypothetical protein